MIVFVTGTGTEVGKTWVLVRVLEALRAGPRPVVAAKPAQSYAPDELGATDAELLAAALGVEPHTVCPAHRWYATPMAPPMAADVLGESAFTVADLAREIPAVPDGGVLFVEGAGGPRSPLAVDGDNVDLARAVGAVLAFLVADAGLGTINAVRLCVDALTGFDTVVLGYQVLTSTESLAEAIGARLP